MTHRPEQTRHSSVRSGTTTTTPTDWTGPPNHLEDERMDSQALLNRDHHLHTRAHSDSAALAAWLAEYGMVAFVPMEEAAATASQPARPSDPVPTQESA